MIRIYEKDKHLLKRNFFLYSNQKDLSIPLYHYKCILLKDHVYLLMDLIPSHKKNQYEFIHIHCHIIRMDTIIPIDNTISLTFIGLHAFNESINSRDER